MTNKPLALKCEIVETDTQVEVGSGKQTTNKIVLKVTNTSTDPIEFSGPGKSGKLSIKISIGSGPKNLVETSEVSTAIKIEASSWAGGISQTIVDNYATWVIELPRSVLNKNGTTRLTMTNFESHTDPGTAKITISANISGYDKYNIDLDVEKKTSSFDLLYFSSDPICIVTTEDKRKFKLLWNAVDAKCASLFNNAALLEEFTWNEENSGQRYEYHLKEVPSFTTVYKLVVYKDTERKEAESKEKQLTVTVVDGKNSVDFSKAYGYPAVLCSNDVRVYGIFIKDGKAGLYSSEHGYAGWRPEKGAVPTGMETSPAVWFGSKLWLVGGSTVNSEVRNQAVWSYDNKAGEWREHKGAPWTPRMGHACVVFDKKLWVLGGNDETGTSLNEVWHAELLENGELKWNPINVSGQWQPRCLFAATVYNQQIWIYGGATEPLSDPLKDMWVSDSDASSWTRYENIPKDGNDSIGKPIGVTLQVIGVGVGERLNLIGSFRSETSIRQRRYVLNERQQSWELSEVTQTAWTWDGQESTPFSLLSVTLKGLVLLRSLDDRTDNNPTKLYFFAA